jgi:uncharacterized protein (DUF1684 family)
LNIPLQSALEGGCPLLLMILTDRYRDEIEAWRRRMDQSLRAEDSWLALAGLYWLSEGSNRIGADPSSAILLPDRNIPSYVGDIILRGEEVSLQIRSEAPLTVDGERVQTATLIPDVAGSPTEIRLGKLTLMLLKRGTRYAIRLWDNGRVQVVDFKGRKWFPVEESYRLNARFTKYEPVKVIPFPNELGEVEEVEVVGYISFSLQGQDCRLDVMGVGGGQLKIIFKDRTSGVQTYPPGRYLITDVPEGGLVMLDFNRAYNPPCAFTAYATCTLPPPQNHLSVPIEAGERYG